MSDDVPALIDVFWCGVHEGAAPAYDEGQRRAWLPARPSVEAFAARLDPQTVFVAEAAGRITGFMTLRPDGHLDLAFVLPDVRGDGTAAALLAMVENHARVAGLTRLETRASDMARPFFLRHGWTVLRPAPQLRHGVTIPATEMSRDLTRMGIALAS
ncbi:GNAT family N-acetyltransferase [Jannaschia sp. S6380]|uniref:GNAT family N-acetyltransferase n=1 Tax=Jannaschia sp. S6380 TaxID=2926408 RepID=UPI001FF47543|nr:GNAT family N-acetyltransferase [Jannaschia sp. S6380]MCK0165993.1 GNAT family N-acetyltransferase [Jannaschia sp. S6380]